MTKTVTTPLVQVEILILAAGKSSRMGGRNKLLEPLHSSTLLGQVIIQCLNSEASEVSVVVPSKNSKLWNILGDHLVQKLYVKNDEVGIGHSISNGIKSIRARKPDGVLIVLADMPEIKFDHLNTMIQAFSENPGKRIIRATSQYGNPGNPVLFSCDFFEKLTNLIVP